MTDTLPEGTDHILPGATNNATRPRLDDDAKFGGSDVGGGGAGDEAAGLRDKVNDLRDKASAKASETWSKYQVNDKAMEFAASGKARASGALDEVARMIGETAGKIDEQIGAGYGDYVRKAAEAVTGASTTLRDKSVDELLEDARVAVRKSPAIAISAAAAAGFALARILKAGSDALEATAREAATKAVDATKDAAAEISDAVHKPTSKPRKPKSDGDA